MQKETKQTELSEIVEKLDLNKDQREQSQETKEEILSDAEAYTLFKEVREKEYVASMKRIATAIADGKNVCVQEDNGDWHRLYGVGLFPGRFIGFILDGKNFATILLSCCRVSVMEFSEREIETLYEKTSSKERFLEIDYGWSRCFDADRQSQLVDERK